jgi:hypothetical protein
MICACSMKAIYDSYINTSSYTILLSNWFN